MRRTVVLLLALLVLLAVAALAPDDPAAAPAPSAGDRQEFVPSQQVSLDSSISFPVDI